jgi:hypothetical protein
MKTVLLDSGVLKVFEKKRATQGGPFKGVFERFFNRFSGT